MNPMNGSYGVPRDIYAKIKQAGLVMVDVFVVFVAFLAGLFMGVQTFPITQPVQMFCFILLTPIIAIYLLLPSHAEKKNWQSLYLAIKRRKKRHISFDYFEEE